MFPHAPTSSLATRTTNDMKYLIEFLGFLCGFFILIAAALLAMHFSGPA